MEIVEVGKLVSFRPAEYDTEVLLDIHRKNPHLTNANDLIRHALRVYHVEATDSNSKTKRLERMERMQMDTMERLLSVENKLERLAKAFEAFSAQQVVS